MPGQKSTLYTFIALIKDCDELNDIMGRGVPGISPWTVCTEAVAYVTPQEEERVANIFKTAQFDEAKPVPLGLIYTSRKDAEERRGEVAAFYGIENPDDLILVHLERKKRGRPVGSKASEKEKDEE